MKQYLDLMKTVLEKGQWKNNRTGIKTLSYFGYQMRFDLRDSFPLLTTKKVFMKGIIHELLWFIKGDTNIKYLVDHNVKIWNEWAYESYKKDPSFQNESMEEYIEKIKQDADFALKHGDLGPVYGKQWRDFNGVDQLKNLLNDLKNNKGSRRLIISSWNPVDVPNMALPPCHCFMQFYVDEDDNLSCQLYQRSADIFLGVPFNIASYSLLTCMLAQVSGLKPKEFVHTLGDAHIYENHLDVVNIQLQREPLHPPKLWLNPEIKSIFDFKEEDIKILDYEPHPALKAKVAV